MDVDALETLLGSVVTPMRKGDEVVESDVGGMHVTEVFGYPNVKDAASGERLVDVHFIVMAVDMKAAHAAQDEFEKILGGYPDPERLSGGPSYIELGSRLGSQELALQMIALGAALGMWDVITPATLGITGPDAATMAGNGMVLMSGWPPRDGSRLADRKPPEDT